MATMYLFSTVKVYNEKLKSESSAYQLTQADSANSQDLLFRDEFDTISRSGIMGVAR